MASGVCHRGRSDAAPFLVGRLAAKNQEELQLLEEVREFLKRRAEIEQAYQDQQAKLSAQFLASRKKVAKPTDGKDRTERKCVASRGQKCLATGLSLAHVASPWKKK